MQTIITKLQNKQDLTAEESGQMQEQIISGQLSKEEIVKIFELFEAKPITNEELLGIVNATRKNMVKVDVDFDCLDNCGTGGDKLNTFNISTVSSIVCASAGIPMAKHGNRAASSKCGSADVLEELGVKIELDAQQAKKCLEDCGIVFMFAPLFHPALKHVKDARVEYGQKTYFNILGPMLNPAGVKHQLIGVSDTDKVELIGNTLLETGSQRVVIVCGNEGMDEISIETGTQVFDFKQGKEVDKYEIEPKDFKLDTYPLEDIKGGDKKENAEIFLNILSDQAHPAQVNAVLLNSAAAMMAFGKVGDIQEGIDLAKEQIESGKASAKLKEFVDVSNKL